MDSNKTTLNFFDSIKLRILEIFASILRLFGFSGLAKISSMVGTLIWHICPSRRNLAVEAIMARLNKDKTEAQRIAKASFKSNIQSFLEIVFNPSFRIQHNPRLLPLSDNAKAAIIEERPVVAILGHIGAWELLAGVLAEFRSGHERMIVVRNQKSKAANAFIHNLRSQGEGYSIGHRQASGTVLKTLRSNGTAAFLVDHNTARQEAIFLPFLGKLASVNFGPALLALRGKAMIYPTFLIRKENGMYDFEVLPPLDTTTLEGSIQERTRTIAEFYNSAVEEMVIKYPEQWFWMHKRWKTRPPEEGIEY